MGAATRATVDAAALRHNYAVARRRAAGRRVIAVVKADAYGHGAAWAADVLARAGCDFLAVHGVAEAAALRDAGREGDLLVLGGARDRAEAGEIAARRLVAVLHGPDDLARVAEAASAGAPVAVHVEVDTGMRRMGVPSERAPDFLVDVAQCPGVRLQGVFTHLARADERDLAPSLDQVREFRARIETARGKGVDPGLLHFANSAGLLVGEALVAELPEVGAVRPGLLLYGVRPAPHQEADLRPVMTLRARVGAVRSVRAGEPVGYAALYRAPRDTRIATLPLGYADGVPVAATGGGRVALRGRRYPIAGRVSMDYVGVDVGDAPIAVGDEAILFGAPEEGGIPVEEAADAAGTLAYELLVRVGARVPRVAVGDDASG